MILIAPGVIVALCFQIALVFLLVAGAFVLGCLSMPESSLDSEPVPPMSQATDLPLPASESAPVAPTEPIRPQAVVAFRNVLDFGTHPSSRPTGEITLTNQGDNAVTLVAVSPTCSCLKPEFSDRVVLSPGGNHTVSITHEPRSQAGPSKATLRFVFLGNDIVNVPVEVMFTRPVKADPTWIDFRRDGDQGY